MQTYNVKGDEIPAGIERTSTAVIVRSGVSPFSETQEDGTVVQGYQWTETRLTPAEASLAEAGKVADTPVTRRLYLLARLADTDYVAAKLAEAEGEELAQLRQEYATVIAQRKQWRAEINSL